jgi:hypothetical protein
MRLANMPGQREHQKERHDPAARSLENEMMERVFDVFWEGSYSWGNHNQSIRDSHVLYALYGSHPVYGQNALLYIGMTERGVGIRLSEHADWIEDESDQIKIRVASMGEITSWEGWDEEDRYPRAKREDVEAAEALLIYAHQPAYNTRNKESLEKARAIRIFNTGKYGSLLPEISCRYFSDNW